MIMKAISLWQPWASLMALGEKKIETRHWQIRHTGPIAIHAAKKLVRIDDPHFYDALNRHGLLYGDLPRGAVLCYFQHINCKRITSHNAPGFPERAFGDYTPGRYMWTMQELVVLPEPFAIRGHQGIWNWKC